MIFNNGYVQLYHADARQLPIPDESIDCVVTSPPYWGLRDYGLDNGIGLEATPEDFCANMVEVFREVWRVLKPTGTVWMNLGDSYATNGQTGGQNNNTPSDGKHIEGFRSARYSNQHTPKTAISGIKPKDLLGMPWRVAFALQADGWYLRSDIIWSKPNPMPESVSDRPTKAHEYIFLLTKNPRYYYDADAIRENAQNWGIRDRTNGKDHNEGTGLQPHSGLTDSNNAESGRNKRTVWEIATQPYPEAHFATYPEKLVEPCILAGCPLNGVVLDPFVGSGTTLSVAQRLGRRGVGTDLNLEYLTLASKRLSSVSLPMNLGV